jgi:hypothetical protein
MWIQVRHTAAEPRSGTCPLGIALAAGFATAAIGCLLASLASPPDEPAPRLLALALIIAAFAATVRNLTAALLTAGIAWSMYLGFLVDRAGELQWHGGVDLVRLGTLVLAALVGAAGWLIAGALAGSAPVPRPREELRPAAVRDLRTDRAVSIPTPDRDHRPQADQGNRRNG